jgi:hypothetical protein
MDQGVETMAEAFFEKLYFTWLCWRGGKRYLGNRKLKEHDTHDKF